MGNIPRCICGMGDDERRFHAIGWICKIPEAACGLWCDRKPGKSFSLPVDRNAWTVLYLCRRTERIFWFTRKWKMDIALRTDDQCESRSQMGNKERNKYRGRLCAA